MNMLMKKIQISAIIPTKDEENNIERLLKSLKNQTFKHFEIIVVDNHSKDQTTKIAKKFTKKVYTFGPERSSQRNWGLKYAQGKYVLFLDADMELEPDVVRQCLQKIAQNQNVAAVVINEISQGTGFLARVKNLEKKLYTNQELIEAPRFFRKKDLEKIGGFDENLISGEDWDLGQRLKTFGKFARIKAKIRHHQNPSLWQDIKKKYYYAKHIKRYAAKHPQLFQKQAGIFDRLRILFKKPNLIFARPMELLVLLILKSAHYLVYQLAKVA